MKKSMIHAAVMISAVVLMKPVSGQVALWYEMEYGNPNMEGRFIDTDADNNIYTGAFGSGVELYKYDPEGVKQWRYHYDTGNELYGMAVTSTGTTFLTLNVPNNNHSDVVLLKVNTSGIQVFEKHYDQADNTDVVNDLYLDEKAGNVYITGYSYAAGNYSLLTIKYDLDGEQEWVKLFGLAPNTYNGYKIITDDAGNVYVAGYTYVPAENYYKLLVLKYDEAGEIQYIAEIDVPGSNLIPKDLVVDNEGNAYVVGQVIGDLSMEGFFTGIAPDGSISWYYNVVSSLNSCSLSSCVLDEDGNLIVAGEIVNTSRDGFYAKLTAEGELVWEKDYDGMANGYDVLHKVCQKDNKYYFIGKSQSHGTALDGLVMAVTTDGNMAWKELFNNAANGNDEFNDIVIGNDHNVFVAGRLEGFSNDATCITVKYSNFLEIKEVGPAHSNGITVEYKPIMDQLMITMDKPTENMNYHVFNACGVCVCSGSLVNSRHQSISLPHLLPGVYIIRLNVDRAQYSCKFIII